MHAFVTLSAASLVSVALGATTPHPALAAAASASAAAAGAVTSPLPLTQYTYAYSAIPYQVNPYPVLRGPQSGFNQCNSTTGGDKSMCQTLVMNNVSDFCLWGSPGTIPNGTIGDIEASTVAYCTKDTHGARTIRPGAITGVQFTKTSAYIQITGHINQTALMLTEDDTGGELDPHGADLLGNPLGGLVYSTGLPSGNNNTMMQAVEWNNFVGGGSFCLKLCDPTVTSKNYCQNIFDLLGCAYNMPGSYVDKEFTSCEGELQDEVGTYTGADGKTTTWSQPSALPATSTLPWTPRIPASSNCITYQSNDLFSSASSSASASATIGSDGKSTPVSGSTGTKTGANGAASTGSGSSGASSLFQSSALVLAGAGSLLAFLS